MTRDVDYAHSHGEREFPYSHARRYEKWEDQATMAFFSTGLLLLILCGAVSILVLLLKMWFVVVTIEGESMAPALHHGEQVLICRCWPPNWLRKGKVVLLLPSAFRSSRASQNMQPAPYLKRITAIAGEEITTFYYDTRLFFSPAQPGEPIPQTWHIPHRHIFVCGDNLAGSIDSRTWGPVPISCVLGVMLLRLSRRQR